MIGRNKTKIGEVQMSKKCASRERKGARIKTRKTAAALICVLLVVGIAGGGVLKNSPWSKQFTSFLGPEPTPTPLPLAKEYIYAGSRLVAIEENGPGTLSPPSNLIATTSGCTTTNCTQVSVSWSASAGADHYRIERSQSLAAGFTVIANNVSNTSLSDTVSSGTAYLYRVQAVAALGGVSGYSNRDLATTVAITDEPITRNVTQIKGEHILQLRQAVNAVRVLAGLSVVQNWTDNYLSLSGVSIQRAHIYELRNNLASALDALGLTAPTYTYPQLENQLIHAEDVQEIRNVVK